MNNKDNINTLFIVPPQWLPFNPPYSVVPIISYLRENGYDAKLLDYNIEFFKNILNKDFLINAFNNAYNQLDELKKYIQKNFKKGQKKEAYSREYQSKLLKYYKIKEYTIERREEFINNIDKIEHSLIVIRDKNLFYNPIELTSALKNINTCLEIASLPFAPEEIQLQRYYDPFFRFEIKDMLNICKKDNLFSEFYEKKVKEIKKISPDLIGISLTSITQFVSALTLAKMLKQNTGAKIYIGGGIFSRVVDAIKETPEIFDNFCDYIVINEGEIPTLKLLKYLNGEISINEVPNLIYSDKGNVIVNNICKPLPLNEQCVSDLSDFDFDNYFTPEIIIPQQSSTGCYWGKCSFCDIAFGHKYSIKSADKFISDIEEINKKYGIKNFYFIDECISPKYMEIISKKILEKNLKISWMTCARLEKEFSEEILKKASSAGLKMIFWGLESASKKILKDLNKGIEFNNIENVFMRAKKAGIWNFAFIFFGFPTETKADAEDTINFIKRNKDIILSVGQATFTLGKHSEIMHTPDKYGITKILKNNEEFFPIYQFETSIGLKDKEILEIQEKCFSDLDKEYNYPLWIDLKNWEIIYLYLCKYGIDKLQQMSIRTHH